MFYFYLNDDLFLSITFYFARIWSDHIQRSTFCHLQIILISVWIHLELKTAVECIQKKDKCVVTLDWDFFWSLLVTVSSTIVVLLNEEVATFGWKARLQSSQQVPAGCVHCIPSSWYERRNFTGSKLAFLVFPVLETSASSHSTRNKTGQCSRENTDWDQRLEQKVLLLKQCL